MVQFPAWATAVFGESVLTDTLASGFIHNPVGTTESQKTWVQHIWMQHERRAKLVNSGRFWLLFWLSCHIGQWQGNHFCSFPTLSLFVVNSWVASSTMTFPRTVYGLNLMVIRNVPTRVVEPQEWWAWASVIKVINKILLAFKIWISIVSIC